MTVAPASKLRLFAILAVFALTAPVALAVPSGPSYPPAGGVTLTSSGFIGRAGGLTWGYADIDMDRFNGIWWGPWSSSSFRFALDGAIDEPGETLVFDFDSNTAGGMARWLGSTDLRHFSGGAWVTETLPLRLTLQARLPDATPIAFIDPTSVALDGDLGAVVPVPGDYQVNALIEAKRGTTWKPAYDLFDSLQTDPNCACIVISVGAGFYTDLNRPPIAGFTWDDPVVERREVTFTSTSSDPEGRALALAWDLDGDGDFGDGTGAIAATTFMTPGDHTVGLRATDDRGLTAVSVQTVTVVDCSQGPVSDALRNVVYPAVSPVAENTAYYLACSVGEMGY